ncbi:hypothetical protein D9756_010891 [Leucocoprinus leucothites]|uniref:F-box domain-containing protein n=1 Tax=Leucocoprinus leucothites TaxID=201217 RepID=A0A8H5CQM9_9AGAR|nr:hypothetical protein D9756_010891 [Leucoagaricus leucothites]
MVSKKNRGARQKGLLKAPLPQLFQHTNARITDEEYQLILSSISRVQDEITRLTEVDAAEGPSQATYRRRQACEDFVQTHQKLLHWTRRVPLELLADIFTWCTEDNTRIPWNVSQVCRQWRAIALRTPQLWRKVPPFWNNGDLTAERRLLTFLSDDYLLRSGEESIIFSWRPPLALVHRAYPIFWDHVERWGDVHFFIQPYHAQLQARFIDIEGRLPLLYALKLTSCFIGPTDIPISLKSFKSAPRLRYMQVNDFSSLFVSPAGQLLHNWPWKQVTHFDVLFLQAESLNFETLSGFRHVTYAKLDWRSWPPTMPQADPLPAAFQSCKYLHLHLPGTDSYNFLRIILFPVLEDLFIYYNRHPVQDGWFIDELTRFIQRHSAHMRSLHWHRVAEYNSLPPIYQSIPVETMLFDHLNHLPSLRLTLPSRHLLQHILKSLGTDGTFMPKLRKLHITVDAQFFKDYEVQWITEALKNALGQRELDEICLRISRKSTDQARVPPWEIVFKLDGWERRLKEDYLKQAELEIENQVNKIWPPSSPTMGPPAQTHKINEVTFQMASLRRALLQFLHSRILVGISHRGAVHDSPAQKEATIQRWVRMFLEQTSDRRWTVVGDQALLYVPPNSPLRKQDFRWVLGVSDYDPYEQDFLDDEQVPGLNPAWKLNYGKL